MSYTVLEVMRTQHAIVEVGKNVIFDTPSISSPEIDYDTSTDTPTGIITFNKIGQYMVTWWASVGTTLLGAVRFELISSQGDSTPGCSPIKTDQVSGFGFIDVTTAGTTLSLVNKGDANISFSFKTGTKAYLLITQYENIGPTGPTGPTGPQGEPGEPGEPDAGTLLSFANYATFRLATDKQGNPWNKAFVGLTNRYSYIIAPGDEVDLSPLTLSMSIPMARDCKITDIGFEFVYDESVTMKYPPAGAVVIGEIWVNHAGSNNSTFRLIPGTHIEATEKFDEDRIQKGTLHLSEPAQLYAGDRITFVVSFKQPPPAELPLDGYITATINIV